MINTYDIDGVINMGDYVGLRPGPDDFIITGRSLLDEADYTQEWLHERGIHNHVYFNPVSFSCKTRKGSGHHKASVINYLLDEGHQIGLHFEDDPVQAKIIEKECPRIKVVRIVHDLVEKENVWHGTTDNSGNTTTKQ